MARTRNLKPSFFKSLQLAECQPLARLLFQGLWCIADKEGRLKDQPKLLKIECLPFDDCDISALLGELSSNSLLIRYTSDGMNLIYIPTFVKHQNPHPKEQASELPEYKEEMKCRENKRQVPDINGEQPASNALPSSSLILPSSIPSSPSAIAEKPKPAMKAKSDANPRTSITITLEHLEGIPEELRTKTLERYGFTDTIIGDEWAKFRNHHLSSPSRHTRVDLCWDTWCRNVAKWQGSGKGTAGNASGQSGFKRHDPVASAKGRAMAELFGEQPQGHRGQGDDSDSDAGIWGTGEEETQSDFVDVTPSDETSFDQSYGSDGSGADSDVGTSLPHKVE